MVCVEVVGSEEVQAALQAAACGEVERRGPRQWEIRPPEEPALRMRAVVDDAWLVLHCAITGRQHRRPVWHLLERTGSLAGTAKFVLPPAAALAGARADIPLVANCDLASKVRRACAGLGAASGRASTTAVPSGAAQSGPLEALCSEAQLPFTVRSPGRVAVDLHDAGAAGQAVVERFENAVHVRLPLLGSATLSSTSRKAIAILLLQVNAMVRFCRAAAGTSSGQADARLEVLLEADPTAEELRHAVAAIGTAARLCAREVQLLQQDQSVAARYLVCHRGGPVGG